MTSNGVTMEKIVKIVALGTDGIAITCQSGEGSASCSSHWFSIPLMPGGLHRARVFLIYRCGEPNR